MVRSISEIAQLWDKALVKISDKLNDKQLFDSFFGKSYINSIHGNTLTIVVESSTAVFLMKNKYFSIITESVKEIDNSPYEFEFIQASEVKETKIAEQVKVVEKQVSDSNFFIDAKINQNYTFDNFVVGMFNREAAHASLMVASTPGKMFNPLFIYSHSGLGKTHLLYATGNYIREKSLPGAKVLYITANDFVEEYIKFIKSESDAQTIKDYFKTVDVLLFDDVQFLAGKTRTQEMFFHVYNALVSAGKQIVIMSDRQPHEINGLEDRLVTRFSQGLTVKIEEPDQNTCVEILKKKIINSGRNLNNFDPAVLYFLAEKFSNDIRELEGSINRLTFYAETFKQSEFVDMDIAIEAMKGIVGGKKIANQMSEQKIINAVADYYNLTSNQLTGKSRDGQIALARHIAMYLIRYLLTDISLKKIGDMFGGKDHTTVMSGITKVENMLKENPEMQGVIDDIKKKLN